MYPVFFKYWEYLVRIVSGSLVCSNISAKMMQSKKPRYISGNWRLSTSPKKTCLQLLQHAKPSQGLSPHRKPHISSPSLKCQQGNHLRSRHLTQYNPHEPCLLLTDGCYLQKYLAYNLHSLWITFVPGFP